MKATKIGRVGEKDLCEDVVVKKADKVNSPSHYNAGAIEVIDAIEDWQLGFHLGNVVKYVARAGHKGAKVEDLKKARWYLNREIERYEGK